MATNRVKGITIEIAGDTTKLDKALRETDGELSRVQKNLRDVERLLKLDPTNVDLLAQKQRLLAQQSDLAAQRLKTMETAASQLDGTLEKSKLDDFNLELDLTRARAENAAQELRDFDPALDQVSSAAEDAADSLDEVEKSSGEMGDGFTVAKGLAANLASQGIEFLAEKALDAVDALWNLDEATEEYRESMAMLHTAFETNGFDAEMAAEAYRGFYEILGETDRATEASQLLSQLASNGQEVARWVDVAAGVYGTFGDSIPIESFIEAANETAKTADVTGVLADALNWVGLSEEEVSKQLQTMGDSTNRAKYLMELLTVAYGDAADVFYQNTEELRASRDAQIALDDSMAVLGQSVENLKTELISTFGPYLVDLAEAGAKAIDFVASAIGAVGDALDWLGDKIGGIINWFQELLGVGNQVASVEVPSGESSSVERRTILAELDDSGLDALPAFARGGLIPPNNPFLAVLGDNTQEAEIVSPLSTLEEAFARVMDRQPRASSAGTSRPLIVNLMLDGQKFARVAVPYLDQEAVRAGVNLVGG